MAQPPVLPAAPRIQLPARGDGGRVGAAAGNIPHPLVAQRLNGTRFVGEEAGAVAQLPVLPLAPGEDPPVHRERHGVLATRVNSNLQTDRQY